MAIALEKYADGPRMNMNPSASSSNCRPTSHTRVHDDACKCAPVRARVCFAGQNKTYILE